MTNTKMTNTNPRILETVVPATEPVVEGESKADTFRRLAPLRVNNALDKIRIVGNLSNRANYEFTDEQVNKIEAALNEAVAQIMRQFRKVKLENKFEL